MAGLTKKIVCLANSKKLGGRCVAGIELQGGTPTDWIRPVMRGAQDYRIALMCAESDPVTCHRTVLVCRTLSNEGLAIAHIHGDGHLESEEDLKRRLLRMTGFAQGDFFISRDALDRAYEKQGRKIAYTKTTTTPTAPSAEVGRSEP